ncbi:FG-nucleoporin nsp1 [Mortierella sp. AD031]|nr:FG-nucleoporin nsp1 [Mortierella sp. AD031]
MVGQGSTFGGTTGGFGGAAAGAANSPFAAKPASGFSFGSATTSAPTAGFGGAAPTFGSGSTFGGAPATSTPFGAAASATPPFGQTSTTAPAGGLFGQTSAPASAPGGFGLGGLEQPPPPRAPLDAPAASTATSAPSLFGTTTTSAAPTLGAAPAASAPLFSAPRPATPAGGLFGGASAAPAASAPAASAPAIGGAFTLNTSTAPAASSPFAARPAATGATSSPFGATSAPAAGLSVPSFGAKPATPSPLSFNTTPAASSAATTTSTTPAFGLTTASTAASSAAATSVPTFGLGTTSAATTTPAATAGLTTKPQEDVSSKTVAPPTPSALRNKSMDEILHQWSKQLDEHTKAFREQAKKVSDWDRKLFANGHQISQLYQMTVDTEETQKTIDQNLDYIDSQQQELGKILDMYEDQVQKMFEKDAATAGVNANGLRPVDEQREQTYSLAESLNKQLDDMSLNLTSMIEEINQTSTKPEGDSSDPVNQIVQILNSHLTSLQWIDDNTTSLQSKVKEVNGLQNKVTKEYEGYRARGVYTGRS